MYACARVCARVVFTYKIIFGAQPLCAVFLQESLKYLPACIGHVGLQHQRLVQDAVVHFSCVATVEGRLWGETKIGKSIKDPHSL